MTARTAAPIESLYVSADELVRLIGVDEETLGAAIRLLERNPKSGFPQKDPLFGDKRYWPKVKAWFEEYNRANVAAPPLRRQA